MRKLRILVGFVLALALVSSFAFAAPLSASNADQALVPDDEGWSKSALRAGQRVL